MSAKFFIIVLLLGWAVISSNKQDYTSPSESAATKPSGTPVMNSTAQVSFENDVLPIFKTNCNPCHFPGGKMYDRMPFDKPATILSHSDGILKRIKKDEQAAVIRQFVSQNAESSK